MDEFQVVQRRNDWFLVEHLLTGFAWGFTMRTGVKGDLILDGPTDVLVGLTLPDAALTQAACDYARLEAEDYRNHNA